MNELHRKPDERPEEWLARLEAIVTNGLPAHLRQSLALSLGYARHQAWRGEEAGRPAPAGGRREG